MQQSKSMMRALVCVMLATWLPLSSALAASAGAGAGGKAEASLVGKYPASKAAMALLIHVAIDAYQSHGCAYQGKAAMQAQYPLAAISDSDLEQSTRRLIQPSEVATFDEAWPQVKQALKIITDSADQAYQTSIAAGGDPAAACRKLDAMVREQFRS